MYSASTSFLSPPRALSPKRTGIFMRIHRPHPSEGSQVKLLRDYFISNFEILSKVSAENAEICSPETV